jgi:hypothetical protein
MVLNGHRPSPFVDRQNCLIYSVARRGIAEDALIDLAAVRIVRDSYLRPWKLRSSLGDPENKNIHFHPWGLKKQSYDRGYNAEISLNALA